MPQKKKTVKPEVKRRPGYRRPKRGEKRLTRHALKIDKLPVEVHEEIRRLYWPPLCYSLEATSDALKHFIIERKLEGNVKHHYPDLRIPANTLARWIDIRIDQASDRAQKFQAVAHKFRGQFHGKHFEGITEDMRNRLAMCAFELLDARSETEKGKKLVALGIAVAELSKANVKQKELKLKERQVALSEKKFSQAEKNLEKETDRVSDKLRKGKPVTSEDIARIRRRTFGEPPKK